MTMNKTRAIELLTDSDFVNLMDQRREARNRYIKLNDAHATLTENCIGVPSALDKKMAQVKTIQRSHERAVEDAYHLSWHWWKRFDEYIELEPRYCDCIVRRWEAATGRTAERMS